MTQQDPYFPQNSSEESSDPPQLPFPEPTDALQRPFPSQQPVDGRQARPHQPLPSTDTIDKDEIRFFQLLSMTVIDEENTRPQSAVPALSSSTETDKIDQVAQLPFPQQRSMSGTGFTAESSSPQQLSSPDRAAPFYPSPQAGDQATMAMPMPGLIEIPLSPRAISKQEESEPVELAPSNQQAKRSIINGVIALLVSFLALATVAGFAGLVIGAFAAIYGLRGLRWARHLPNRTGRRQAHIGIVLGLLACSIVLAAIIFRAPLSR